MIIHPRKKLIIGEIYIDMLTEFRGVIHHMIDKSGNVVYESTPSKVCDVFLDNGQDISKADVHNIKKA